MRAETKPNTVTRKGNAVVLFGKPVGVLRGDVFHRTAPFSRAVLRMARALSFDAALVAALTAWGVRAIRFTDSESGRTYEISLADFRAHAITYTARGREMLATPIVHWLEREVGG